MLNENLKAFRKSKGLSQEQLSARLHVVRQTVSKWEQGLSVPDAEMLVRLAEVLDVSVGDLLGKTVVTGQESTSLDIIARELEKLNELLAARQIQRAEQRKKITAVIVAVAVLLFVAAIYDRWNELFYEFGQSLYHLFH